MTRHKSLNFLYFLFIYLLLYDTYKRLINGFSKESWQVTEFLINYQGGFVRRGLLGEMILKIYYLTGVNPYTIIITTSAVAYLILILFFVRLSVKNNYSFVLLPFIFFLGNPIMNDFWIRKDILIVLIFILTIYFSLKKSNWNLIIVNLFLIFGLLTHESLGFFCFPILFLILFSKNKLLYNSSLIKTSFISVSQLIPSIFVFLCVLHFKGSREAATQIWQSWRYVNFPIQVPYDGQLPAAIDGISWSLETGLSLGISILHNLNSGIYAPLAWILILITIYYILTNTHKINFNVLSYKPSKKINRTTISNILIFQFITVIPLFILGWDYSRWIFFWTTSSFAIILLVSEEKEAILFPKIISTISTRVNNFLDSYLRNLNILFLSTLVGFCPYAWDFASAVNSNAFLYTLRGLSAIIHHLLFPI
ncbi:MAG: hypothetical protein ABI315_11380 [Bacteroidia bacterium]